MPAIIIDVTLDYGLGAPSPVILMLTAAQYDGQTPGPEALDLGYAELVARVPADEGVGERIMLRSNQDVVCSYRCTTEVTRANPILADLNIVPVENLPGDVFRYSLPSRYCESDELRAFVMREFGELANGAKIAAIRDWIERELEYVPGASQATTTARDTFISRQGVCRDYAHLMIAMCRAAQIPARFCSVYAPLVQPPDFHAVVEVYLSGSWHLLDPTGMATADEIVVIAVGRDATDVAFMTSIFPADLRNQAVIISTAISTNATDSIS